MDGRCALRLTRHYRAAPAELWEAVRDLERWLAPPPGVTAREIEPGRVLELDWQPPGETPSVVRIVLAPEGDGTMLVLDHTRIEATKGMRYLRIWGSRVERLR